VQGILTPFKTGLSAFITDRKSGRSETNKKKKRKKGTE